MLVYNLIDMKDIIRKLKIARLSATNIKNLPTNQLEGYILYVLSLPKDEAKSIYLKILDDDYDIKKRNKNVVDFLSDPRFSYIREIIAKENYIDIN